MWVRITQWTWNDATYLFNQKVSFFVITQNKLEDYSSYGCNRSGYKVNLWNYWN